MPADLPGKKAMQLPVLTDGRPFGECFFWDAGAVRHVPIERCIVEAAFAFRGIGVENLSEEIELKGIWSVHATTLPTKSPNSSGLWWPTTNCISGAPSVKTADATANC